MEEVIFEQDIPALCLAAASFPDGVSAAHQTLHDRLPTKDGRQFFGISHADQFGKIVYFAAATEMFEGEAEQLDGDQFTIKKGVYNSIFLKDYYRDVPSVGAAFQRLLADPAVDPFGYCLEIYTACADYPNSRDVQCLVLTTK
ncbi:MAG: transcriptional regulator [Bacteroidota bacterium]